MGSAVLGRVCVLSGRAGCAVVLCVYGIEGRVKGLAGGKGGERMKWMTWNYGVERSNGALLAFYRCKACVLPALLVMLKDVWAVRVVGVPRPLALSLLGPCDTSSGAKGGPAASLANE